jgi:hypothetical protein
VQSTLGVKVFYVVLNFFMQPTLVATTHRDQQNPLFIALLRSCCLPLNDTAMWPTHATGALRRFKFLHAAWNFRVARTRFAGSCHGMGAFTAEAQG